MRRTRSVARLRLGPAASWVAETYPVLSVEDDADGWSTVELVVVSERWLERLLLRLGPAVEVLDPHEYRDVARRAASRLLARYR